MTWDASPILSASPAPSSFALFPNRLGPPRARRFTRRQGARHALVRSHSPSPRPQRLDRAQPQSISRSREALHQLDCVWQTRDATWAGFLPRALHLRTRGPLARHNGSPAGAGAGAAQARQHAASSLDVSRRRAERRLPLSQGARDCSWAQLRAQPGSVAAAAVQQHDGPGRRGRGV